MYGRYFRDLFERDVLVWSSLRNDDRTTAPIRYSINPKESTDAILAIFNGLQTAFFALLVMLNLCGAMCCEFCDNVRDSSFPRNGAVLCQCQVGGRKARC